MQQACLSKRALALRATTVLFLLAALVVGCVTPAEHPALDQAGAAVERARETPRVRALAPAELERAEVALQHAHAAAGAGAPPDQVEHLAYVVSQRAALAETRAAERVARSEIGVLQRALDQVLVHGPPDQDRQARPSLAQRHQQARAAAEEDRQARTSVEEDRQARVPAEEDRQARMSVEEERQARASVEEDQQERASVEADQQTRTAEPDPLAAIVETVPQEITLPLAELPFADAQPTSEALEELAALAERLLLEPGHSLLIAADFDLPEPEARTMMERRVEVVRAILLQRGIAPARLIVRAGTDDPAEPRAAPSFVEPTE